MWARKNQRQNKVLNKIEKNLDRKLSMQIKRKLKFKEAKDLASPNKDLDDFLKVILI